MQWSLNFTRVVPCREGMYTIHCNAHSIIVLFIQDTMTNLEYIYMYYNIIYHKFREMWAIYKK